MCRLCVCRIKKECRSIRDIARCLCVCVCVSDYRSCLSYVFMLWVFGIELERGDVGENKGS